MINNIQKRKIYLITPNMLLFIYFLFLFVHTLHMGANKTLLFGYLVSICTLLLYVLNKQRVNKKGGYVLLFLFLSFFLYLKSDLNYINSQLKYWVYLVPLIIVPFICNSKDFNSILCKACLLTLIISVSLFILGIGIDTGYGFPRMHGLLSEPSALSLPISVVLLNGIFYKKKKYILISLFCILLTGSLMTVIITFFSYLMYLFITRRLLSRVLLTAVFLFFLWSLFILIDYLAQLGTYPSISRLQQGIVFIQTFGANGHNPRFFSVLEVISYIQENNFLYGGGINGAEKYIEVTSNLRDLNLWLEILLSFGIVGTALFFVFLLVYVFFNKYVFSKDEAIILSSITVYCFLNSAQGIVFQSLFFIILFQVLSRGPLNVRQNKELIQKT
jgi:hypothetical protein